MIPNATAPPTHRPQPTSSANVHQLTLCKTMGSFRPYNLVKKQAETSWVKLGNIGGKTSHKVGGVEPWLTSPKPWTKRNNRNSPRLCWPFLFKREASKVPFLFSGITAARHRQDIRMRNFSTSRSRVNFKSFTHKKKPIQMTSLVQWSIAPTWLQTNWLRPPHKGKQTPSTIPYMF